MSTHITVPEQGDRILYRHGRADLPHGTPTVVPGVIYETLGWTSEGERTQAEPDEIVVLAHDCMGQPILARGDSHRLPRALYAPDATEPGSWCYAPADSHAGRDEIEVPLGCAGPSGATDIAGTVRALEAALCPTWTEEEQRELDSLRRHVRLCSLGDRPQHPGVEKMRRLGELEQRARAAAPRPEPGTDPLWTAAAWWHLHIWLPDDLADDRWKREFAQLARERLAATDPLVIWSTSEVGPDPADMRDVDMRDVVGAGPSDFLRELCRRLGIQQTANDPTCWPRVAMRIWRSGLVEVRTLWEPWQTLVPAARP